MKRLIILLVGAMVLIGLPIASVGAAPPTRVISVGSSYSGLHAYELVCDPAGNPASVAFQFDMQVSGSKFLGAGTLRWNWGIADAQPHEWSFTSTDGDSTMGGHAYQANVEAVDGVQYVTFGMVVHPQLGTGKFARVTEGELFASHPTIPPPWPHIPCGTYERTVDGTLYGSLTNN